MSPPLSSTIGPLTKAAQEALAIIEGVVPHLSDCRHEPLFGIPPADCDKCQALRARRNAADALKEVIARAHGQ